MHHFFVLADDLRVRADDCGRRLPMPQRPSRPRANATGEKAEEAAQNNEHRDDDFCFRANAAFFQVVSFVSSPAAAVGDFCARARVLRPAPQQRLLAYVRARARARAPSLFNRRE